MAAIAAPPKTKLNTQKSEEVSPFDSIHVPLCVMQCVLSILSKLHIEVWSIVALCVSRHLDFYLVDALEAARTPSEGAHHRGN